MGRAMGRAMVSRMGKRIQSPTRIPNAITRVMSWGYGIGIGFQNRRFDRGIGVTKLDRPVISIGNLSAGGTGKTPMVHWIANELAAMGKHPAIAMRGYKAPPGEMGDEEREHRQALPGVPVVAQPDRIAGLQRLFETDTHVDCVILDDGFQHRQLARDVEIVLIDASSPPYADALLPRGYLRDPISSLARADAVVITHREMVSDEQLDELVGWIKSKVPGCPVAVASHEWDSVTTYTSNEGGWDAQKIECEHFAGKRILGMCAIGNPAGFFAQIHALGWDLVEEIELPDHYAMDDDEIGWLCALASKSKADAVCMTRKDWVKVSDRLPSSARFRVIVPELGFAFESGEDALRALIAELEES
jgi:tetraacyldisaccharide 4'-kinase